MKVNILDEKKITTNYKYKRDGKYYKYHKLLMIFSCIKDWITFL